MKGKYYTSFWNYVPAGDIDNGTAVADWVKMGMTLPMSWEYVSGKSDKTLFLDLLDKCAEKGLKVIICDNRTNFYRLRDIGEKAFIAGVKEAVADFGSHPATFGFHIGDEPGKDVMSYAIKAYRIVKSEAPDLHPFINLLPYWEDYADGAAYAEHIEYLDKVVKESGMEMICYDYYGQMATNETERLVDLYFKELNLFGEVARRNDIPLWTTLLSTAHYNSKTLTEDDIMWQIATAVAHGASGIFWFYVYFASLVNGSYRNYPIANYDEEQEYGEVYYYLSRQNRILLKHFATKLDGFSLSAVRHYNVSFGGTALFTKREFEIDDIKIVVNKEAPLIISRFTDEKGNVKYIIVNNDRQKAVKLEIAYREGIDPKCGQAPDGWIAPGQMTLLTL